MNRVALALAAFVSLGFTARAEDYAFVFHEAATGLQAPSWIAPGSVMLIYSSVPAGPDVPETRAQFPLVTVLAGVSARVTVG